MECARRVKLLALFVLLHGHVLTARRYGCLFDGELCEQSEVCANDGLFGRCQRVTANVYSYGTSPAAQQHLRNVLQKLSHQGYTRPGDATQLMISRELLAPRKTPLRYSGETFPASSSRTQTEDGDNRKLEEYLQELGFLPDYVTSSKPNLQVKPKPSGRVNLQRFFMDPKGRPPSVSSRPRLQSQSAPRGPYWTGSEPPDPTNTDLLSDLLQYLSGPKSIAIPPQEEFKYSRLLGTGPAKSGQDSGRPPRPRIDRLTFGSGLNRPSHQDSLSSVDERFVQGVVKQLGRHSINTDTLTKSDLDQLSEDIAQVLQVVDGVDRVQGSRVTPDDKGETKREPGDGGQHGEQDGDGVVPEDGRPEDRSQKLDEMDPFLGLLLGHLDSKSEPEASDHPQNLPPILRSMKLPQTPSNLKAAGLENVRSRTTQTDVDLTRKKTEPDASGPDQPGDAEVERWLHGGEAKKNMPEEEGVEKKGVNVEEKLRVDVAAYSSPQRDGYFGYIITDDSLSTDRGLNLMENLARRANIRVTDFLQLSVLGPAVTFRVKPNISNISTALLARIAVEHKGELEVESGVKILEAGLSDRSRLNHIPVVKQSHLEPDNFLVLMLVSAAFVAVVLGLSGALFCVRRHSGYELKEKLVGIGTEPGNDATTAYQDLCRQRMAERGCDVFHTTHTSRINSVSSQFSDGAAAAAAQSPSARSSTSSWSEEPAQSNMDISTGHMILTYMEDHLQNQDRLEKEWEALCAYQAEPATCSSAQEKNNAKKNRANSALAYDHSRFLLKVENNQNSSDYINASLIMDHDPRNPAYISAQGPLPATVADFWQMVWESGCVVIVMLTPLSENGTKQCHQYWPDEGSDQYHIYEVNLVSEHIWCEDFLVRSFYLKNVHTNETRTVTQFHFLSWMDQNVPESARTLLDFRRKVNKCYRGRSCPIIIHCSDGSGRSGTYILIDMVLNKLAKGAKEIDIAATLEHLRDQRANMVHTKEQFEFALTAVAEEVNAILKALPQ
ncbi:receptor-type tyrosine-protein phosphatase N2 isoform X2 [Trichomycterus rosablanca]|uniref:receptor-type tyrosine-protein phosphatase N2 isoform X2 n=1 Tax=Trichomycterus rosablanca TaxID=2290929 RepID=UPI002F355E40